MKFTDEHVRNILLGKRAVRRVQIPDLGCDVGIRLLSETEGDAARVAAAQYVEAWGKKRGMSSQAIQILDETLVIDATKREIVWRAFVDADKPDEKFFPSVEDVLSLSAIEVDGLYRAYVEHQEATCPRASLSDEAVEQLIDALGKDEAPAGLGLLTTFERGTLEVFVRSMALRLRATSLSTKSCTSSEPSTTG